MTSLISRFMCLGLALYFVGHAFYAAMNWEDYVGTQLHFIRYLLAPLGLAAVFALAAFLLRQQTRLLVGIYASVMLVALYMVEFYLTSTFYFSRPAMVEERQPTSGVSLGFTPHRLNGFIETATAADAILGHVPFTKIELCSVDYGPVHIQTDRFGLNNPDDIFEKPISFAITGDSFIHGHCQPSGKDVVSLVRGALPATANMGLTGSNPLLQLAVIGRNVASFRPAHVVSCFYEGNDLRDLPGELSIPWLSALLEPAADFGPVPAKAETLAKVEDLNRRYAAGEELPPRLLGSLRRDIGWRDLWSNPVLLRNFAALNLTSGMLGLSYGRAPSHLAEYRAVMMRKQAIVEGWGGQLHLCYLPSRQRFGLISSHYASDETRSRVLQIASELGLGVVDVTDSFAAHPQPRTLFASDGHLSIDGAAFVAEQLTTYLADLVPMTRSEH